MGEPGSSGPLVPYGYSSEEEEQQETPPLKKRLKADSLSDGASEEGREETPPLKKRIKPDSLSDKSCEGGFYLSFPNEVNYQTNFGDNINPELRKNVDDECDCSPSETEDVPWLDLDDEYKSSLNETEDESWRRTNLIAVGDEYDFTPKKTDDRMLENLAYWEMLPWRDYDPKRREVYCVSLKSDVCTESECLELLKRVGCVKRFVCCSVERPCVFYAKLNEKEAVKLKGVKEVFNLHMYKCLLRDC